jgi:Sulfotransferase family
VKRQYGWLDAQKNMLAFRSLLPKGDFFHVKYEDIIEKPKSNFAAVCEFIGVAKLPEIGAGVHSESLTRWKNDPYFTLRLDPVVKQMAIGFGYREDDLENPIKPEPPLSYRFRKWLERVSKLTRARLKDRFVKPILLWLRNSGRSRMKENEQE